MHRKAFTLIEILIGIGLLLVIGGIIWKIGSLTTNGEQNSTSETQATPTVSSGTVDTKKTTSNATAVQWNKDGQGSWKPSTTPPDCPAQPMLKSPTDLTSATSRLYPGQKRGGNYKPHGGLRFDSQTTNAVSVLAPMDAYVVSGSRYLEGGELQYMFDFINSCGVMYRFDHLATLTDKFQAIADKFPAASEGDSRTNQVQPAVLVEQGELIATEVGATKGGANVFFDFGVYDLRNGNAMSTNTSYTAQYGKELAGHAVCWFTDWLPATDAAALAKLPAGDSQSGTTSDYCK